MSEILTSDHYDLLSDEAQGSDNIQALVQRAEWYLIDKHTEQSFYTGGEYFHSVGGAEDNGTVYLKGWEEKDDGTPDVDNMNQRLLKRLRYVIARLVNHWHRKSDIKDLESETEGSRTKTYKQLPRVPQSIVNPLRNFDQRPNVI